MINHKYRIPAVAAFALAAVSAGSPAFADYLFQTATAGAGSSAGIYSAYGDGTDGGSNFIGTTFALSGTTSALQVGGNLDGFGIGSAFAEVVSVSTLSSLPNVTGTASNALVAYLQNNSLGTAVFNAPTTAGDASAVINFSSSLTAGNYALIFGSGLFGATGSSVFGSPVPGQINFTDTSNGNVTLGSPTLFDSAGGDSFATYSYDTGIRIFAVTPVPLPAGLPLLLSGLSGFVFLRRSRRLRR